MVYSPGAIIYNSLEPGQSYGLFGGYNFQTGDVVYGGELSYQQVATPGFGAIGFPNESFEFFLDAKLRGGYVTGNALIYGFVGYSSSAYSVTGATWDVAGTNYGIGVDYKTDSNLFFGVEYIVRDVSGSTNIVGQTQDTRIEAIQLRAGWDF